MRKAAEYTNNSEDLKIIYFSYIRSIIEQSSVIWGNSITEENEKDLERVQKNALRIIYKEDYTTYEEALELLKIDTLKERRK